jgi:hypothetical protein
MSAVVIALGPEVQPQGQSDDPCEQVPTVPLLNTAQLAPLAVERRGAPPGAG